MIGKGTTVRNLQHVEHGRKYRLRAPSPQELLDPWAPPQITRLPVLHPGVARNVTRILGSNKFFVKGENLVSECGHHRFSPEIFGTTIAGLKDHDRVILIFKEAPNDPT
jgi:hypothetical protein